jgi:hypothetical protein
MILYKKKITREYLLIYQLVKKFLLANKFLSANAMKTIKSIIIKFIKSYVVLNK